MRLWNRSEDTGDNRGSNRGRNRGSNKWGQKNLFLLFSLEIVSIAILIVLLIFGEENPLSVPMVVIFGVVAFLGVLTLAAAVLDFFNLSDKSEALGLPSGSVRALIALSLILIFAIMVIFMAINLSEPYERTFEGSSNVIYGDKNITSPTGGDITILLEPSQAAIDFSKQVLTTISTLVVALAGFYFGTRSVAQAQRSTEPPEVSISISPPSPKTLNITGNPDEDKVVITVTTRPENELIMFKVTNDAPDTVRRSENPSEFMYTPSNKVKQAKPQTAVTLEFWMLKYPGDKEELIIIVVPKPKNK